jgi:hypothetical protein
MPVPVPVLNALITSNIINKNTDLWVISIVLSLLISGEQIVHGQIHVQVGALQLTDDQIARAALKNKYL